MINSISKLKIALASGTLALCLLPSVGWSTRPVTAPVVGEVTALPGGHEIEVGNHMYHIQKGSAAEKALINLSIGQQVRLFLGDAEDPSKVEVVGISVDSQ